jgi:putative N6-adenine-specific DNA methylase
MTTKTTRTASPQQARQAQQPSLRIFLPCASGVEDYLNQEVQRILNITPQRMRGGVWLEASWVDMLKLNLWSRLAQRVLVQLSYAEYRSEADLYELASEVPWETWFTPQTSFKIELTAQHSPLKSLNFAALKIKDAVVDRFRHLTGMRPDVDTHTPQARIHAHLTEEFLSLYIDTSGEPLFKRGWREDKGEAPLKETLAAAMLAASGWSAQEPLLPLYDPCCGSGTIAIEAAQIALNIAPGHLRHFGFEKLLPYQAADWQRVKQAAHLARKPMPDKALIYASDVAFRMVDFAQRNAERAGVAALIEFRGGDALQRLPPCETPGVMLVNPPYGERIDVRGVAGRERAQMPDNTDASPDSDDAFFIQLARHWKTHYHGWKAWVLSPDLKLPGRMRMKESRRVPLYNGPIECRMFGFEIRAFQARTSTSAAE